ncbi:MAG: GNAT family N-acetyltransferase [Bacteroidetes bacterium]|nr:GNAT family N-acetyltransferase [Bacteroidota bacterium]
MSFNIRKAAIEDSDKIYDLIVQLAVYEKMENEVESTAEQLKETLFDKKLAHALVAEEDKKIIGFALYFYNYSTFVGKKGLYLEDLFIDPNFRGKGYGKALLLALTQIAHQEKCGRMEWSVLNWNQPAIDFYESLGAQPMNEWTVYRLTEKQVNILAQNNFN